MGSTYIDGYNPPGGWREGDPEQTHLEEFAKAVRDALRTLNGIACWDLAAPPGHAAYMNRASVVARAALAYAALQRAAKAHLPDAALVE